ncbi:MAG: hypothetical protein M1823_008059, partial [Watsoniomyces obsoletus]
EGGTSGHTLRKGINGSIGQQRQAPGMIGQTAPLRGLVGNGQSHSAKKGILRASQILEGSMDE